MLIYSYVCINVNRINNWIYPLIIIMLIYSYVYNKQLDISVDNNNVNLFI